MNPYVLSQLPQKDIDVFEKIQRVLTRLPEIDLGLDENGQKVILSCHIIARAFGKVFGLKHVDGLFYPNFQHTWLLTASRNTIDVYPVGMLGGPLLLAGCHDDKFKDSPGGWLYKSKRVLRGRNRKPYFRRAVKRIEKEIRKLL